MKYKDIKFAGNSLRLKDFVGLVKVLATGDAPHSLYKFLLILSLFNLLLGLAVGTLV